MPGPVLGSAVNVDPPLMSVPATPCCDPDVVPASEVFDKVEPVVVAAPDVVLAADRGVAFTATDAVETPVVF